MIVLSLNLKDAKEVKDSSIENIEKVLCGESESRYEKELDCWVFFNKDDNGHMYEEDTTLEDIEGTMVFARNFTGGELTLEQKEKIKKVVEEKWNIKL